MMKRVRGRGKKAEVFSPQNKLKTRFGCGARRAGRVLSPFPTQKQNCKNINFGNEALKQFWGNMTNIFFDLMKGKTFCWEIAFIYSFLKLKDTLGSRNVKQFYVCLF